MPTLAVRFGLVGVAALSYHVRRIFFRGTQKEMRWVHAPRIVAVVARKEAGRNRSISYLIGVPMSRDIAPLIIEHAVAAPSQPSLPFPAAT